MSSIVFRIKDHSREIVKDFVVRLNQILQEEPFGSSLSKITVKQLYYFSKVTGVTKRYRTFNIKKKSGGSREINAPCHQLNNILRVVNVYLESIYTPSLCVTGFTKGRSVVDNAKVHVGHNYVFNIDLKDFFSSIPQARVWARLQLPPFNFSQKVANLVAGLCCYFDKNNNVCVLPQGAPTSPLLTNAICDKLDKRMLGVAKRFGLHYTRYADDMTFSSMHNVYHENGEFQKEIKRIIEEQGFSINNKKTRLLRSGNRQEVTGLVVNNKVNVTRKYVSDIRWLLHIWEKEGYARAYSLFYSRYKDEKGYLKKGEPILEHVLGGKLNYLRMVRGCDNVAYKKLQARYNKLQQIYLSAKDHCDKSYIYVQPYTMREFTEYFSTSITLTVSSRGKLFGKCILAGAQKILPISVSTQKSLCPNLSANLHGEIITSNKLQDCNVVLCHSKGKNFWLITEQPIRRSKHLSIQSVNIDTEELLSIWEQDGLNCAIRKFQKLLYGNKKEQLEKANKCKRLVPTKTVKIEESNFKIPTLINNFTIDDEIERLKQEKLEIINYASAEINYNEDEILSMLDDIDEIWDDYEINDYDDL